MIAVDANILVYAHREESPHHKKADSSITRLAESSAPWAIPWPCVHEFISIVTRPGIYDPPSPLEVALGQIEAWRESPSLVLLAETELHWTELRALAIAGRVTGARIHDARIAALCRQHGVRELWSSDRDFRRFAALRTVNPLV